MSLQLNLLNRHPSTADTHGAPLNIMDSFHSPNCTQIILSDPDLMDAHRPLSARLSTIVAGVNPLSLQPPTTLFGVV